MLRLNGLWRHHDFLFFWLSNSLSLLSIQFGRLALPLVAILTLNASAAQVGVLAGLGGLPWLIFGLIAGIGIDRRRRRPILIAVHIGRACLIGSVPVAALLDVVTMAQLYVVAFGVGALGVYFETAYHSYLPSLVSRDQLAEGNGKLAIASGVTRMAGPSVAGSVVQWLTPVAGVGIGAIAFLGAGALMWRIRTPESPPSRSAQPPMWGAFRDGLYFVWRQTVVRAFTLSEGTYMFCFALMQAVLLVFFVRTLGLTPGLIGVVFSAGSMGGVVGAMVASRLGERYVLGSTIISGSAMRAIGLAMIPLATITGPFAVPMLIASRFINAFGWTIWQVHQETTQQLVTPDDLRGRVTGSSLFMVRSLEAGGSFAAAILAARMGIVPILTIGAVGALVSIVWLIVPAIVRLRTQPTPPWLPDRS